jgi:hypothetical protein
MPRKPVGGEDDRAPFTADEEADERFDRTLRNLLNTPPKPRKAPSAPKEEGDPRRGRPGLEGRRKRG